jgi:hypothetical protein
MKETKGWKEIEAMAKQKEKLAVELQDICKALCVKGKELMELNREHFALLHSLYGVDTLFEASLLSPSRLKSSIKWFLIKYECPWELPVAQPERIVSIFDLIQEGNKWVTMKFRPKKPTTADRQTAEHLL